MTTSSRLHLLLEEALPYALPTAALAVSLLGSTHALATDVVDLDESCTVTVGNQTATVRPDGTFYVENVAVFESRDTGIAPELYRARATCVRDGAMVTGQSAFFTLVPGATTFVADIVPSTLDPIPVAIEATAPVDVLPRGESTQLSVIATHADGTTEDVTARASGTTYLSTNTALVTVSEDGLVTGANEASASAIGSVAILNEGNLATVTLEAVGPSDDLDNDGMTNDWEDLFGLQRLLDDATGDLDGDGLTNLDEFRLGTLPNDPDTDMDGVLDGVDGDPLHPEEGPPMIEIVSPLDGATLVEEQVILFAATVTDDGLLDVVELAIDTGFTQSFTAPPFQTSLVVPVAVESLTFSVSATDGVANEATATTTVAVIPDPLTTVVGTVVDGDGAPVGEATVETNGGRSGTTLADGTFEIGGVPTVTGEVQVEAELLVDGRLFRGRSDSFAPVLGGVTDVGTITLGLGEFAIGFQENFDALTDVSLFVSAELPAEGQVEVPGVEFVEAFTVEPGTVTEVALPDAAITTGSDVIRSTGVAVSSNVEISVYGLNQRAFSTDAFVALPLTASDVNYRVLSYTPSNGSQFAVVATQDATTVSIVPSVDVAGYRAGEPFVIELDRLEVYQLRTTAGDLTGTSITGDKPIAVFAGDRCGNVPPGVAACDHMVEQMPPVETWGRELLTVSLASRRGGDTFRILADVDGTTVQIGGSTQRELALDAGEYAELVLEGENVISADQSILVAQYAHGEQFDDGPGDPFIMVLYPAAQFKRSYTFTTPGDGFAHNFVNLVVPTEEAETAGVVLDGEALGPELFSPIGSSGFSGARIAIDVGTHTVSSTKPFGTYVYGFNDFDSYGYSGGARF